jgi:hypothetical protein
MGIPEGKRPLGRARHSWTDNKKVDLEETYWVSSGSEYGPV